MEKIWSIRLIRLAATFGVLGTVIGSSMSGSMDYGLRPIHAHILLAGWLSVFAWGIFYRVYKVRSSLLVNLHGWTAVLGSIGLTSGMWFYNFNPFNLNDSFVLVYFIIGGTLLLVSFILFLIATFFIEDN